MIHDVTAAIKGCSCGPLTLMAWQSLPYSYLNLTFVSLKLVLPFSQFYSTISPFVWLGGVLPLLPSFSSLGVVAFGCVSISVCSIVLVLLESGAEIPHPQSRQVLAFHCRGLFSVDLSHDLTYNHDYNIWPCCDPCVTCVWPICDLWLRLWLVKCLVIVNGMCDISLYLWSWSND